MHNRTVRCGFPAKKKPEKLQEQLKEGESVETKPEPESLTLIEEAKPEETISEESGSLIQKREASENPDTEAPLSPTTTIASLSLSLDVVDETKSGEQEVLELEEDQFVDDWQCDPDTKPVEVDKCFKLPCDETGSVEWIISAWSSCDTDCGSQISNRKVVCSTRDGEVFSDDVCLKVHGGEKPADTQDCSEKYICSRSVWFTSEWSACSVGCGAGMKTRHVFCGHVDESTGKVVLDEVSLVSLANRASLIILFPLSSLG